MRDRAPASDRVSPSANTSLDDIARDAGVGPGTLYRHFPTREELLEAVYRTEMEKLASAEQKFAAELPTIEALRAWLLLFVDYIAAKQLIAPALNALLGDPKKVFEASYARMWEAIRALVERAHRRWGTRLPRVIGFRCPLCPPKRSSRCYDGGWTLWITQ